MYLTLYALVVFSLVYFRVIEGGGFIVSFLTFGALYSVYVLIRLFLLRKRMPDCPPLPEAPSESVLGTIAGLIVDFLTPFPVFITPLAESLDEAITEERQIEYLQALRHYQECDQARNRMVAVALASIVIALLLTIGYAYYAMAH